MGILKDAYSLYLREMYILKKNLRSTIARSMIFPIVLILFLGSLGSSPKNLPVAVVNYANNLNSFRFINAIESGSASVQVVEVTTQGSAMAMLYNGRVNAVIVIPQGFVGGGIGPGITLYMDSSSPIGASSIQAQVNGAAASLSPSALSGQASSPSGSTIVNYVFGASSSYKSFLIAGVIVLVSAFGSIFGGGMTLLTDRQLGNLKAFFAAPINRTSILLSKIATGVTQSFMNGVVALAIGLVLGGTVVSGLAGVPYIFWYIFLSSLGFAGIATAMGSRINKIEVYTLIAQSITLPMYFLSGAFLPTSSLPPIFYEMSKYNPMTYATNAMRDVMLKGYMPIGTFLSTSAILIGFSAVAIAASILLFKNANYQ